MLSLLLFLAGNGSDPAALERALASVRPGNICADVRFIASDELEGRDTPSHGQRLAARYLRARVERLGFQPCGDAGFFDEYRMTSTALDMEKSGVAFTRGGQEQRLAFGRDYGLSSSGVVAQELEGGVVAVGAGATKEDYAGLELAGRWALVLPSRQRDRGQIARDAGAIGMIVLPDPADNSSARWLSREPKRTTVEGNEGSSRGPSLPTLYLTVEGATALLGSPKPPARGTDVGVTLRDRRVLGASQEQVLENVAALWPGSDPALRKEVIILSAHYDHVGVQDGEIYNGADDNGSGTCGLLAVAEALQNYGPMKRSVLILWVSGEEKGLWGSAAWTKKPTLPAEHRAVLDINIDMIGRNAPDLLQITPTKELKEYNGLTRLAESLSPLEGFPKLGNADQFWQRSDQVNFAENLKIPVAFLFSDLHEDYHQPTDDADKIDCDKIRRVSRLVVRMLDGLQGERLEL